ncbi:MAG: biotin/lipoyl-binding protein, partial [Puniceicoccales bacterium]|nr:biotin/lipoyl-binding protein [Puniceicoccales bacterium]
MNTVDPRPSQPDLEEILQENGDGQKNQRVLTVIALIAAVLIFGGLLLWLHYRQTGNGKPTYVSEQIQRDNIKLIVTATGNLEPTDQVTIGSEISGIVKEVYVDYNDVVSKDQAIARIDTSELEQQIAVARATIASAEARVYHANVTLKETKAALKRYDELLKISGGRTPSRADYELVEANAERAQAELHTAQASVDEANAQLKTHEIRLAKAVIKSPV